jgi:hypothetical protein
VTSVDELDRRFSPSDARFRANLLVDLVANG